MIIINKIRFDWDKDKENLNKRKHGISFVEAAIVFFDEEAIEILDPDHSIEEERFVILGSDRKGRIITVAYCLRSKETIIRIISARLATNNEIRTYYLRNGEK